MKKLIPTLLAIAAGLGLGSCSESGRTEPAPKPFAGAAISVSLSRAAGEARVGEAESAINPEALAIVLRQGSKAEAIAPDHIYSLATAEAFTVYCDVEDLLNEGRIDADKTYSIEVYANAAGTPTAAGATDMTFSRNSVSAAGPYIPMFGFKRDAGPLKAGVLNDAGTIDMLRAAAKLTVALSADLAETYEFVQTPELANGDALIPAAGYVAPHPDSWAALASTVELEPEGMFRPMASAASASARSLAFHSLDGGGYYLCVPEAVSPEGNTREIGIDVRLRNKTDHTETSTGRLYLTDYVDGVPADPAGKTSFRLVRNHTYAFTITEVRTDYELGVVVTATENKEIIVPPYE